MQRQRAVNGLQQRNGIALRHDFHQRFAGILNRAHHADRRRRTHNQGTQHGAEGVNVRPRALLAFVVVGVLLNRRKARAQHGFRFVGKVTDGAARGAEIEQHRQAVILDLDVIQRDVSVQIAFVVDGLDRTEQHRQRAADPGFVDQLRLFLAQARKRGAAVKQRPHVGRVVLHPEAQNVQQVRVVKARQQTGFLDKAVQACGKRFAKALAAQHQGHVVAAYGERGRHKFFDSDSAFELVIPRAIDNAKTAAADHLFDFKLVEAVPDRERVWDSPIVIIIRHLLQFS